MFGKENDDDSFFTSNEEITEKENTKPVNSQFIFYNDEKKLSHRLEFYVIINNHNENKNLILVDSDSTIDYLCVKIVEYFEIFPEFKNLSGLKAQNLTKKINNTNKQLPNEGIVENYIKNGDIIYCDLISYETWISTIFKIQCFYFNKNVKTEYKFNKNLKFKTMKLILLRCAIDLFIDQIKRERKKEHGIFYVKHVQYKITTNKNVIFDNNSNDEVSIKNLFHFNSEIHVHIKLGFFEELIHNEIRTLNINNSNINRLRLIEYNDQDYEELLNDTRFSQERKTIREIAKNIIKNEFFNDESNFVFYTLSNKQKVNNNNSEKNFQKRKKKMSFSGENLGFLDDIDETEENEDNKNLANMLIILPFFVNISNDVKLNKSNNLNFNRKSNKRGTNQIKIPNNFKTFLISTSSTYNNNIDNNLLIDKIEEENDFKSFIEDSNDIFELELDEKDDSEKEYNFFEQSISSKESFLNPVHQSINNLSNEFKRKFSYNKFYKDIEKHFKYFISRNLLDNIIVPQSREIQVLDKDNLLNIGSKRRDSYNYEPKIRISNIKIIIFISALFLYFSVAIILLNLNLLPI